MAVEAGAQREPPARSAPLFEIGCETAKVGVRERKGGREMQRLRAASESVLVKPESREYKEVFMVVVLFNSIIVAADPCQHTFPN